MTPSRVVRVVSLFLLLAALPTLALAGTTEFRVFFDVDADATTGCTVGDFHGIEQVLVTQVTDDDTTPRVTRTHRQICTGGILGGATDVVTSGWPSAFRSGDRTMTLETRIPFSSFGTGVPESLHVGFDATRGAAVHEALANADGTPIMIPGSPHRRRAVGERPSRTFVLDGALPDWGGIDPVLFGAPGGGTKALRLLRILSYANTTDSYIYFAAQLHISSDAPFADEDEYLRTPGENLSVGASAGVLKNDGDPNNRQLAATKISEASRGTVILNSDGSFTYSPNNPASPLTDEFEYQATNGSNNSNVARVRIKVNLGESPDGPENDSYETNEDTTLTVTAPGVLANDPPGNAGTSTLVTPPSHGTVILNPDGGFIYKPAKNFFGTDTFVYSLTVGNSPLGGNATVTITVKSVNDAPTIQPATFSIAENSPNGTPVGTVTFADADNDNLTLSITSGNTGGAFTIDASTGAITVANSSALDFETTPTFNLTVRVQDNGTPSKNDSAIITINLTNVNDRPVITAGGTLTYTENDPATVINGSLTVTDDSAQLTGASVAISGNFAAGQDVLSFTPVGAITGVFSGNTLTLSGTDTVANYQTALRSVRYQNTSNNPSGATRTITWTATDGSLTSTPVNSTVNVIPVNDAPVAVADSGYAVNEGGTLTNAATVLVNDTDEDNATLTAQLVSGPANATSFTLHADGTFDYTHNGSETTSDSFTYRANDGTANSNTVTVSIAITSLNDAPVLTAGGATAVFTEDGAPVAVDPAIAVADNDDTNLESATVTITNLLDGASETLAANTGGTSIVASYLSGVLTLTGTDSKANYQTVLQSVTYSNASQNPTTTARSISFVVNDGTANSNTVSKSVTIVATNDAPVFTSSAAPSVPENTTAVLTVTTTDSENDTITYSISGGADAALFTINSTTGALSFLSAPNFEAPADAGANNVYDVTVTANDGTNAPTQNIAVTVTNVNEPPVLSGTPTPSVPENTTPVMTVTATDPEGAAVTYSITGGADAALFTINSTTGALSFLSAPDFEAPADAGANNVYDVVVTASDGTNAATQNITVTVTDVNEAPVFSSSATPSVAENTTAVVTVTANDPEAAAVTYSITGGVDAALFTINSTTGALSFLSAPNFEAPADAGANNVYDVAVTASDGTNAPTQNIAVTVTDVNEAPVFTSSATPSVAENTTAVVTVTTTDQEGNTIAYSITGGADAALFTINSTTGALSFLSAPNFEAPADAGANNVYDVVVTANDGANTPTQNIAVTVTDVNEAPVFTSTATPSVAENTTAVVTVVAVDPEGTAVTYSITGGADAALFTINSTTGALSFLSAPNFEAPADAGTNNVYDVAVTASDGTNTPTQNIAVTVTDANEAPSFTSSATPSVPENTTAVVTVTTSDPEGNTITYSITGGADAALFTINSTTGALSFIAPPNFEAPADAGANNVYDVVVTANDGANAPTQNITVTVTNVNEGPAITSPNAASFNEDATGTVLTVSATDPEGDAVSYSITGGADSGDLSINPTTGAITFNATPDFEAPADSDANNTYVIQVTATSTGGMAVQTITITVNNVNDPPSITSANTANVNENTTAVLTVTATDPDGAPAPTFSIVGGVDAALFSINSTTGALSFLSAPNFEAPADAGGDNVYNVTVRASDGTLFDDDAITVTVLNVNEAPSFTSTATPSVQENTTAVVTVTTTDPEGNTVTYSITGGADQAKFTINSTTGALSFLVAPDFEVPTDAGANNVYDVIVTASDGTNTPAQNISVTVTDFNDPPVFTSSATPSVPENTTAVTTVTVSDPENDPITFSITGGADAALFTINSSTGALSFLSAPNFEAPADAGANNVYNVVVTASDGTYTPSQAIAVTVTNVSETPVFTSSNTATVPENSTTVLTVTTTDPDGDTVTYSISGGADAAAFAINSTTGALTFIAPPNYEIPTDADANNVYEVIVKADDGPNEPTQTITVTVTNVQEPPVFTSPNSASFAENATGTVLTAVAVDSDGDTVTYSITGGADSGDLTINPTTGAITFNATPNFEAPVDSDTNNTYVIQVTATSTGGTDVQTITITVTNVNEQPVITSGAPANVPENTVGTIHTVTATDPDGTSPTFSIVGGADAADFNINSTTGALTFVATPNFEAPADANLDNVYEITVRATDGTLFDDDAYTVTVTNVNEAPIAGADAYNYIGNTELRVAGHAGTANALAFTTNATNPKANDSDPDSIASGFGTITVVATGPTTTPNNGVYRIEADGTFYYTPPAGYTGTDTITYQLTDGTNTVPGTITLTMTGTDVVWYVRNNDPTADAFATNNGTSSDPFNTLVEAQTASGVNHIIYVHVGDGTTTGQNAGIVLKNGQDLIGNGVALVVNGSTTLIPAGTRPSIGHAAGDGVTATNLTGNIIRGLNITGSDDGISMNTSGASAGDIEIADNVIIATTNFGIRGVAGSSTTTTWSIHDNTVSGTAAAMDISRTAGTAYISAFDDNVVPGTSGGGIVVTGVTNPIIFDATPGAAVQPVSGGITMIGTSIDRISNTGLALLNVAGTLNFTDLDIFTDANAALIADGGAGGFTFTVAPTVSTIVANAGGAVSMTDITGLDLQLAGMTSTNSAAEGVALVNTTGTFSAPTGSTITNAAGTDFFISGGTVNSTYNGTITDDVGTLVSVANSTGGTKVFAGAISDGFDGDGSGISLTNNTGATVRFSGGVELSTGANAAFTATGGGTVEVCDENVCNAGATGALVNRLSSTTGIALNVANTTIGANDLEFRSISANGASSGIVLNNTGSSGNLAVKGNGGVCSSAATCTGGAIQNTSGPGISLTNTTSPSFVRLFINSTGGSGVNGTTTTNFTFTDGKIDNSGNTADAHESNIAFNLSAGTNNNIAGIVTITGNTLTNAAWHGIDILNFSGTISDANISNNTITSSTSAAASLGSGLRIQALGSATTASHLTKATIATNTITNFPSDAGIEIKGGNSGTGPAGFVGTPGNATNKISITGNIISGASAANRLGTLAIEAVVSGGNSGARSQGNFDISGNTLSHTVGHTLGAGVNGYATGEFTTNNNTIISNNSLGSNGISGGVGTVASTSETGDMTWTITGNNISQTDGNGILAVARGTSGTLKVAIKSNTVAAPLGGARSGIRVDAGNGSSLDDSVCADIQNNTSGASGGVPGISIRKQGSVATTNEFGLEGLSPSTATYNQAEDHVAALNPGSVVGTAFDGGSKRALVLSGTNFVSCSTAP